MAYIPDQSPDYDPDTEEEPDPDIWVDQQIEAEHEKQIIKNEENQ